MPKDGRPVVVVTRADAPDETFAHELAERGIAVQWAPTIAVVPPDAPWRLDAELARLTSFAWVAFTSAHAVDAVVQHPRWRAAWRAAAGRRPRLAAVGPATAGRLLTLGWAADLQGGEIEGDALGAALAAAHGGVLQGVRILWPASSIARRELPDRLRAAGAALTEVVAYKTIPVAPARVATLTRELGDGSIDAVAFFSPSAARSLADAFGPGSLETLAGRTLVASIGPTTSAALRTLGAPPDLEAAPHTAGALAALLAARLGT